MKKDNCKFDDWSLEEIKLAWQGGSKKRKLILPNYQRSIVWREDQRKEFIKSLKEGFPVGSILLYEKGYDVKSNMEFTLIDGLQRITTIKKYISNPCNFFDIYDLDQKCINIIKSCLYLENNEEGTQVLTRFIREWINNKEGFDLNHGYSGHDLARFLKENLEENLSGKIVGDEKLVSNLNSLLDQIKKEAHIEDIRIPVTIYTGEEENLPDIFERVNSKGTKLNRYDIYSASWVNYGPLKIENKEICNHIKKRYEKVLNEGWEVENYDENINEFTYYEYFLGFGKLISEKFSYLFGKSDEADSADSCGFNLLAACMTGGIRKENLEKLPALIKEYSVGNKLSTLETNVLNSIKIVFEKLNPIISIKTKRRNSDNDIIKIAHSETQIISLIAKHFKLKYKDNFLEEKDSLNQKNKLSEFTKNIEFYYLFDILNDVWRGSGDSNLAELLKNDSKYESPISKERWNMVLDNFFAKQLDKREKKRVSIKFSETILLNYIYSKCIAIHKWSNTVFHFDHIIPINALSRLVESDGLEGLPIGHVANLCLLSDTLNNKKGKVSVNEFYEELKKLNEKAFLKELDEQLLTKLDDKDINYLIEGNITKAKYEDFLRKRFEIIKQMFFSSYNIE